MIEGGTVNGTRSISFLAQLHAAFSPFSSARRSASWPFGICNKRRKGHLGYQGAVGYEGVFIMFIIFFLINNRVRQKDFVELEDATLTYSFFCFVLLRVLMQS